MGIKAISVTLNEVNMAVGARWAAVLGVSQTADGLGFFFISRVHRGWFQKEKISKELQLCGGKPLVDVRGRNGRLAGDHRKETVAQITTG